MARTERIFEAIRTLAVERESVVALLNSRSEVEATCAYSRMRDVLPEPTLVALANVRELLAEIPETPFTTAVPLSRLTDEAGYERSGSSFRRLFDSENGVFGIEFRGSGRLCRGIVVHTGGGMCVPTGGDVDDIVDPCVLEAALIHSALIDEIVRGLKVLGVRLEPRVYLSADDFSAAHAAGAASEMLGGLF